MDTLGKIRKVFGTVRGKRVLETVGKKRLKEDSIRKVLLMCSERRNYNSENLWIMSIKDNEMKGITMIEGEGHEVNFKVGDIIDRIRKDETSEFILIHNHPNGDPRPSKCDMNLILQLWELRCKHFELRDFIIFSEKYIYSQEWNKGLLDGEVYPIFWPEDKCDCNTIIPI